MAAAKKGTTPEKKVGEIIEAKATVKNNKEQTVPEKLKHLSIKLPEDIHTVD